jgi:flagellar basal body L-ring protein FlgH
MKRAMHLFIAYLFLLLLLAGCSLGGDTGTSPTPTPTNVSATATSSTSPSAQPATPTSSGENSTLEQIATQYYNAIEAKHYTQAYTYLDARATDADGKVITLSSFEQLAQMTDSQEGTVQSFTTAAFTSMVIMTITRTQLGPYHAHLQMKQEGNTWKIISLDRI